MELVAIRRDLGARLMHGLLQESAERQQRPQLFLYVLLLFLFRLRVTNHFLLISATVCTL